MVWSEFAPASNTPGAGMVVTAVRVKVLSSAPLVSTPISLSQTTGSGIRRGSAKSSIGAPSSVHAPSKQEPALVLALTYAAEQNEVSEPLRSRHLSMQAAPTLG